MPSFNAYGKLAPIALDTYDCVESEGDAWDYFLSKAEECFPDYFPTWEDVESEDDRCFKPCANLDFILYRNIEKGNEIIEVGYSNVCEDLFKFLEVFQINEITVCFTNVDINRLSPQFESSGWVLSSFSSRNRNKNATFKRR